MHWVKWSKLCRPKNEGGMGFRELQKFNDALLAKQVWRLASEDSLFFRFFEANFFPHGSIFDAKEKNGSYAWRSILKGREVIMRGLRWRIGDGSAVQVYQDNWLPTSEYGRFSSPISDNNPDTLVASLIDQDLCSWREVEIDRLFLPREASIIKAIPLSFSSRRDKIFWPSNHDGVYTVKSRYKLLMEMENVSEIDPNSASTRGMKSTWNRIWQVEVPNRICLLMWRAGNDSLLTRVNLVRRKMGPEDTLHALWMCPQLAMLWKVYFADLIEATNSVSSFLDVIQLAQHDWSHFVLFAWTLSLIWMRRNKLRLQEGAAPLAKISFMACEAL